MASAPTTDPGTTPSLDVDGPVATITLRRPAKANRLEGADIVALETHCGTLRSASGVLAVIVTATGRHFSAGFDLGALAAPEIDHEGRVTNALTQMIDALQVVPQVTICALNGGVFGGATELALACDFRIGTPQTRLRMPAARLGLHYPVTGLKRFTSRIGVQATRRLFLLAEDHDAAALLHIGYLDAVVAPDRLMEEARAWAGHVTTLAPLATRSMKATLDAIANGALDEAATERAEVTCLRSADLREGIEAARQKRTPDFKGR